MLSHRRLPRPGTTFATAAAAVTLMLLSAGAAAAQTSCAMESTAWRSTSHSIHNDRHRIELSRPGCELNVDLDGDLAFTADLAAIERLSRDGRLRIEERDGGTDRVLEVRPGPDGRPEYTFRVDRRDRPFDAEARAWLSGMLIQLFRGAGLAAEQRAAAILEHDGVPGMFAELELIPGDHVRSLYVRELLRSRRLDADQLRRLLAREAARTDSDHYLAATIEDVAATQEVSSAVALDMVGAARALDSDHYRYEVLRSLAGYTDQAALRGAYLDAAAEMDSDHYRYEALAAVLDRQELDPADVAAVLAAARRFDSDHYRSELLRRVRPGDVTGAETARAFLDAVAGMDSDHYAAQSLATLIDSDGLSADLLPGLIDVTRTMDSDHYRAEVLVRIAGRHHLTGAAREAYLRAMDGMESDHYRGQVAQALLRQGI